MSSGIGRVVRSAVVVDDRLVGEQVGDAAEARLGADRQLERGDAARRRRRGSCSRVRSKSARSWSSLLMKIMRGTPRRAGKAPQRPSVCTSTPSTAPTRRRSRSLRRRGPARPRCTKSAKPGVSIRLILWSPTRRRRQREGDRDVAFQLFGFEVTGRGAVFDPSLREDRPGGMEQRLGERGLARTAVPDEGDGPDPRRNGAPTHIAPAFPRRPDGSMLTLGTRSTTRLGRRRKPCT